MSKTVSKVANFPFNWLEIARDPMDFVAKQTEAYNHIVDLNLFFTINSYLLCTPEEVEHVLVKNNRNYCKGRFFNALRITLGNGLAVSEGEFWKRQRRIVQPAFHKQVLASFTEDIGHIVDNMIAGWKTRHAAGHTTINVADEMMKLMITLTLKLLFGTDMEKIEDRFIFLINDINQRTIRKVKSPVQSPLWIPTPGNIKFRKHLEELQQIIIDIIEKRRKQKTNAHRDMLQMLMDAVDEETGERMSDIQLRDEAMNLFLAGSETSANTLAWTLHLLAENKEKDEKVRKEIDEVAAEAPSGLEVLKKLRYMQMVIQESMRIYPPIWIITREAIGEDEINGYRITKGAQIFIPVRGIHMNHRYWPEPEKFEPERFESSDRHKYSHFPFGGGPRFCIGAELARMEITLALYKIIKEFRFENAGAGADHEALITLRPKNGELLIKLYPQLSQEYACY